MAGISIGEAARSLGVAPSALRFYERHGLVSPGERRQGQRVYDSAMVERLKTILQAKAMGFTLKEIKALNAGGRRGFPARLRRLAKVKTPQVQGMVRQGVRLLQLFKGALDCACEDLKRCMRAMRTAGRC